MEKSDIDPYFIEEGPTMVFSRSVDPRYFLISDKDLMDRYHFAITAYGLGYDYEGLPNKYKLWGNGRMPKCESCKKHIVDSSDFRKRYGAAYHGECFSEVIKNEWKKRDKRYILKRQEALFLRVAGLLDNPTVVN